VTLYQPALESAEPQVVIVRAVDDRAVEGAHTTTIARSGVSSAGSNYNSAALTIAGVLVRIADNDTTGHQVFVPAVVR
jgi:hypothetical protein